MSRLPNIGTSIFSVMSQMANQHQAINLSQGFPDFPVDPQLLDITSGIVKEKFHQYMPSSGYPPLLKKISEMILLSYQRKINPETEILVTAGATQGIFTAIQALVNPGEEVIILDPAYDSYDPAVRLVGAKPVHVSLNDDYTPDWTRIEAAMNSKTRMLIINNPHNPTGKTWKQDNFLQLERLLDLHPNVLLLSDEVYEHITFDEKHISIHSRQKLLDRSIIISSFGKSFHITGWKIGYVAAPAHLTNELKKVHQFVVFSVNSVAQAAISAYMDMVDVASLGDFYKHKRDLFRSLIKETKFELLSCEGSYFQIASYANISNESDIDFTKRLVRDYGVAAIPVSAFYTDGKDLNRIRFCFAKEETTLLKAAERLLKI